MSLDTGLVPGTSSRTGFVTFACAAKRHASARCNWGSGAYCATPSSRGSREISGMARLASQQQSQQRRRGQCLQVCAASTVTIPQTADERLVLLERLQRNTLQTGTKDGLNVVAFGGGAASTLAAYLAHAVFEGKSVAVFVRLPGTTEEDVVRVNYLASFIGIDLWQIPTAFQPLDGQAGNEVDDDVPSGALPAALAAIRGMLQASGGPPSVVFDGLHAEDLPNFSTQQDDMSASWEGSEDSGEAAAASYASVSEAADRDVDLSQAAPLPGLPAARRVSLLAGLPEIAVRAVADLAGMPNWDWVKPDVIPSKEPPLSPSAHDPSHNGTAATSFPAASGSDEHRQHTSEPHSVSDAVLLSEARHAVQEVLQLKSPDDIQIRMGQAADAVVHIDPAALSSPNSNVIRRLRERLNRLGLRPIDLRPAALS